MRIDEISVNEGPLDWASKHARRLGNKAASKVTWGDTEQKFAGQQEAIEKAQEWLKEYRDEWYKRKMPYTLKNIATFLKRKGLSVDQIDAAYQEYQKRDPSSPKGSIKQLLSKQAAQAAQSQEQEGDGVAGESVNEAAWAGDYVLSNKMALRSMFEKGYLEYAQGQLGANQDFDADDDGDYDMKDYVSNLDANQLQQLVKLAQQKLSQGN